MCGNGPAQTSERLLEICVGYTGVCLPFPRLSSCRSEVLFGSRQGASSRNIEASCKTATKQCRAKRVGRSAKARQCEHALFASLLLGVVVLTMLGGDYLFSVASMHKGQQFSRKSHKFVNSPAYYFFLPFWLSNRGLAAKQNANLTCEIDFRNSTKGLREPDDNQKFAKFILKYIETEERQDVISVWEPRFAGHQTLEEREESFKAKDQTIHCGFVQGAVGSSSTGFDLAESDIKFLRMCHIAISSCIFGNSDNIRSPRGKKFTGPFKKEVCFVMFVDQRTFEVMQAEDQIPDDKGYVGLWKIVVVRNLPYLDARRTGKIPKFLTHRLFPAARYSIWIDSKLRLQSDPVLILEHFLWKGGYEYALSNHYDRHCVWEEVQQNKKLNKFNHTVIDEQFVFYQADGLTKFNASDPKKLLPSYVPEGSFIVRAHTPMSNLFSCLWFNEVDRFTPRDQLSFAYTYLKLVRMNADKSFYLNMFKDCERRTIAKLYRHRRNARSQLQRPRF